MLSNPTTSRPFWTPTLGTLPNGDRVLVTAVRTGEIVFDRVNAEGLTLSNAHAVPFSGLDPEATELPTLADVLAAIASPPALPAAVPSEVTRRQLWLALNAMAVTRAAVKAQLTGNEAALIELEEATAYRRDNPLVQMLGSALGLTSAEIDGVFIEAAKL